MMEEAGGGEGDNPEADHERADGEDPFADVAVGGGEGGGFVGAEDLAADADGHEQSAEDEGDPGHGFIVLPWGMVKWQGTRRLKMKRMRGGMLVLGLLLAVGGVQVAGAQKAPPTPPKGPANTAPAPDTAETLGVEFVNHVPSEDRENLKGYLTGLASRTRDRWMAVLPAASRPPLSTPGEVKIVCWVHTDGRVTNMAIEQASGKVALDRAAWAAITGSAPYGAFPYGIAVDQVKVRFTFDYNGGAAGAQAGPNQKPR